MAQLIRIAAAILCLHAGIAQAVLIDVQPTNAGSWIFLRGEFKPDDGARFLKTLSTARDPLVVVLESNGGSLKGGLDIGSAIRDRQLSTLVMNGTVCASACAAAWLGGTHRYLEPSARIGFHSAYTNDWRNRPAESRGGNALLGAYLNRLGLTDRAIYYITDPAPTRIAWLTETDAQSLGIEVSLYGAATTIPSAPRATAAETAPQGNLEQAASQFPAAYFEQTAQRPEIALDYFENTYAEDVTFNGALVPRAQVMAIRRRQAERWPEQSYAVRPDSVAVRCNSGSGLCEVSGITDWEWSSWGRGARANGSSRFWFQISLENNAPVIRAETLSVINRDGTGPQ